MARPAVLPIGPTRGLRGCAGILLLMLAAGLAYAINLPPLTGRVVDQANVIPPASRAALETKLKDLEDKSGIQLVVATVSSLQDRDIETFANGLFRNWKLGEAKKNNGVLLLVAPKERKVRIEVGYGLEGTLTDALSKTIIAGAIVPRFKENDFAGGIDRGVDGIISVLASEAGEWQPKPRVRTEETSPLGELLPLIVLLLVFFVFAYMVRNARGTSGRWLGRDGRTIFIPPYGGRWQSPSGWAGDSPSGGGFSGAGGSSGGAGASGNW